MFSTNASRLFAGIAIVGLLAVALGPATRAEGPYSVEWSQQIGTSSDDRSYSVAVDGSGNAYISGETGGSLGGPNAGSGDAFLVKFSPVVIPLPGAAPAGLGLLGAVAMRRRR